MSSNTRLHKKSDGDSTASDRQVDAALRPPARHSRLVGVNAITISKGSTITFATDASGAPHNLVNGSNGQANIESGAPDFTSDVAPLLLCLAGHVLQTPHAYALSPVGPTAREERSSPSPYAEKVSRAQRAPLF